MKKILLFIILLVLCSCSTIKYIEKEIPVETIRTEYINKYVYDSVYIKDSIYVEKNDSIIKIEKFQDTFQKTFIHDTLLVHDTIPVPIKIQTTEYKEVNKLHWYQKGLMSIGIIFIILIVSYVAFKLIKRKW